MCFDTYIQLIIGNYISREDKKDILSGIYQMDMIIIDEDVKTYDIYDIIEEYS
jgi:hypothetical protein